MKIRTRYLKILIMGLFLQVIPAQIFAKEETTKWTDTLVSIGFAACALAFIAYTWSSPEKKNESINLSKENEKPKEPEITQFDTSKFSSDQMKIIREKLDDKDQTNWQEKRKNTFETTSTKWVPGSRKLIYNVKTGSIFDPTNRVLLVIKKTGKKIEIDRFDFEYGISRHKLTPKNIQTDQPYQRMVKDHENDLREIYKEILK